MFDDTGFGGNSMFDTNHDGYLNAFERDNAECFLHDCDTYDQVTKKEGYSNGYRHTVFSVDWSTLIRWIIYTIIFTIIGTLMGL